MMDRHPFDGKPYYCETCGLGFGEVMACEDVACVLETFGKAQERRRGYPEKVAKYESN